MIRKTKKETNRAIRASVKKEMSMPRMARSAKVRALNLDPARIPEESSTTLLGTVEKIIPPSRPNRPEKAQIAVERADCGHRNLRIENLLTDEHGDDVELKKGARVEVTVTSQPKTLRPHPLPVLHRKR